MYSFKLLKEPNTLKNRVQAAYTLIMPLFLIMKYVLR